MDAEELRTLVEGARRGDARSWDQLVQRLSGLLWAITGAYPLTRADAADVVQVTWLRLVEHLDQLKEPERVGAWLCTTARRESLRVLRSGRRETLVGDEPWPEDAGFEAGGSPEQRAVQRDEAALLWRAFRQLGARCRELLRVLFVMSPAMRYDQVAELLGLRIGSIGPIRARCLDQLRRKLGD